ncbi:MAG TPA: DUF72 domain-containing protein [Oligoflexia bacterium]|nr:DUF72 domain-containing protein [Oligoflexia bacterium]
MSIGREIYVGTVGYNYRDWIGSFYPKGASSRRQLQLYSKQFNVCELTQFTYQMPEIDRMQNFVEGLGSSRTKFFVRIHNALTHGTDIGLALTVARHFRRALEPLVETGRLAGFVATFPYAFKNSDASRMYLEQLAISLACPDLPLFVDFRHSTWVTPKSFQWMAKRNLSFVCVDEPELPGLMPPLVTATQDSVLIRLHGRNATGWWSGNLVTRYDYLYSKDELSGLLTRYLPLLEQGKQAHFLFANHWQAQSIRNGLEWRSMLAEYEMGESPTRAGIADEDVLRAPVALPLEDVKSRVSLALSDLQISMDLPPSVDPESG